jgi:hypothetical protein
MRKHTLLPLAALGLALGLGTARPAAAQRDRDERPARVDTTYAFAKDGIVSLTIVGGGIRVRGGTTSDIRIVATIERGWLETSFSRTRASIEARSASGRMGSATYEITVPVGTRVHAHAVSGDIDIQGTEGEVSAESVNGDVTVANTTRRLDAETVGGELTISKATGLIRLETVNSDIIASDLVGDVTAETVSGEIELRTSRLEGLRASSVSGSIRYDGPFAASGTYQFETHSGDIDFSLPAQAGAALQLETYSGRISSDFPLTLQPNQTGGRRDRRMEFTLGAGGSRITAETFSGNITIRRLGASGNRE